MYLRMLSTDKDGPRSRMPSAREAGPRALPEAQRRNASASLWKAQMLVFNPSEPHANSAHPTQRRRAHLPPHRTEPWYAGPRAERKIHDPAKHLPRRNRRHHRLRIRSPHHMRKYCTKSTRPPRADPEGVRRRTLATHTQSSLVGRRVGGRVSNPRLDEPQDLRT